MSSSSFPSNTTEDVINDDNSDDEYEYEYEYDDDDMSSDDDKREDNKEDARTTTRGCGSNAIICNKHNTGKNNNSNNKNYDHGDGIRLVPAIELLVEMDTIVRETSDLLGIPAEVASILLRKHDWSNEQLCEAYYSCTSSSGDSSSNDNTGNNTLEDLWKQSGIYHRCCQIRDDNDNNNKETETLFSQKKRARPTTTTTTTTTTNDDDDDDDDDKLCPICYESMTGNNNMETSTSISNNINTYNSTVLSSMSMSMSCGHEFCIDCWKDYCSNVIVNENPTSCIQLTCPDATCTEAVTEVEIQQLVSLEQYTKYRYYVLSSFLSHNPMTRWCPAPGCDKVAYASSRSAMEHAKGIANCKNCNSFACGNGCSESNSCYFCMYCGEEPHAPCDCQTLSKWNEKNQSESETANWMIVNTKSCPKCKIRIEKNHGCNHMTCRKCNHNFCWICLADWANHRTCNTFASTKDQSTAKQELERYLHYFTRYQTHKKSEEFAKKQLKTTEDMMIQSDNKHPVMDIQFMIDVNKQLIDCRRVLKYSYVYGYYNMNLAAARNTTTIPFQKERFEQYQAVLEKFTESLSGLSEKPMENFDETIRADAVNQCRVVKKYIDNVLLHVEEGMDED